MTDKAIEAAWIALEDRCTASAKQTPRKPAERIVLFSKDDLRAAIAAYEQALWRPIEEATTPSSDTDFLLAWRGWPSNYWEFEVNFYRSSKGGWINGRATHYRPLPPPPVTQK